MKRTLAFGIAAAASILGAFALPAPTPAPPAGADRRLLASIAKANRDFEAAMTRADVPSIVAPYAADALFVTSDGTVAKGRDRIEQLYRDRFAKSGPALETRIESEQLMIDGDLAYERGRGTITRRVDGNPVTDTARFLTVWQRQPDGDWKISRNLVFPAR